MVAVPEAIAGENMEKSLTAAGGGDLADEVEQQPVVEGDAPSAIEDDDTAVVEEADHEETGVLDEKSVAMPQDSEDKVSLSVASNSKGPILGGASPSEASSEWPEQGFAASDPPSLAVSSASTVKSVITYYLVRIPRRVDGLVDFRSDARVKDKLDRKNLLVTKIQQKLAEKKEVFAKGAEPREHLKVCRAELRVKVEELTNLKTELRNLNRLSSDTSHFCKSEEDLDAKIASLQHRLQQLDGPITIQEEKQIVREIKALRASREQVIIHANFRASKQDARQGYQTQLKLLQEEVDELAKKRDLALARAKPFEDKFVALKEEIDLLMEERKKLESVIDEVFSERRNLSSQEKLKNSDFYENRKDIMTAKQLAHEGDRAALEESTCAQVERIMSLWNMEDSFRSEYVKNNLQSTVRRLGTPDGRSLGPNEEPFKFPKPETSAPAHAPAPASVPPVPVEKEGKKAPEVKTEQPSKSTTKSKQQKPDVVKEAAAKTKSSVDENEHAIEAEDDEVEVDRAALLEMERERRREVELEKAREAEARKKKRAEKKEAKAQVWLGKELQRREKEKEKKLQKKTAMTDEAAVAADTPPEQARESTDVFAAAENGEKNSPEEKKSSTSAVRRGRKPAKSQINTALKLQLRRKRPLHRQLFDQWQLIAALGVALVIVLGATMVFVTRA